MLGDVFGRPAKLRATAVGARHRFRVWRGERPFWAGLFTFKAGLPILYLPYAHLQLGGIPLALSTTSGAGSLVIGVLLMVLGLSLWYRLHLRMFAGVATLLLALISFPVANFGGLLLGLSSALIGGALACAWIPPAPDPGPPSTESLSTAPPATAPSTASSESTAVETAGEGPSGT
ncbi:DUF6114 domain-containing protein [Streptomyces sp. NPDC007971]|uniref:DUF6114 domain-containing protein n=1 Tax=Streptomyces sp. NPDC007971 TaxID=3364799 RepID=UPI0036E423BC